MQAARAGAHAQAVWDGQDWRRIAADRNVIVRERRDRSCDSVGSTAISTAPTPTRSAQTMSADQLSGKEAELAGGAGLRRRVRPHDVPVVGRSGDPLRGVRRASIRGSTWRVWPAATVASGGAYPRAQRRRTSSPRSRRRVKVERLHRLRRRGHRHRDAQPGGRPCDARPAPALLSDGSSLLYTSYVVAGRAAAGQRARTRSSGTRTNPYHYLRIEPHRDSRPGDLWRGGTTRRARRRTPTACYERLERTLAARRCQSVARSRTGGPGR